MECVKYDQNVLFTKIFNQESYGLRFAANLHVYVMCYVFMQNSDQEDYDVQIFSQNRIQIRKKNTRWLVAFCFILRV